MMMDDAGMEAPVPVANHRLGEPSGSRSRSHPPVPEPVPDRLGVQCHFWHLAVFG